MNEIKQLIRISQFYGSDSRYVIAGGGNTSYKNADKLWVKASGHALATITEEGFAVLDRNKLNVISQKQYPADTAAREEEVKNDLAAACITKDRRPSVETSLHNALSASFIVHLHPTLVNGLMCAQDVEQVTKKLFGDEALYIPYIDPGYILFKEVERRIREYTEAHGHEPAIILLQNHGIFVGAESTEKIQAIYDEVLGKIEKALTMLNDAEKPLLIAGGGVILADASPLLVELAELLGTPVVPTLMGWGSIPDDHDLMAGMVGLQTHHRYGNANFLASDFVMGIGNRWANRHTGGMDTYTKGRKFVHIDIEPTQLGKVFCPDYAVV